MAHSQSFRMDRIPEDGLRKPARMPTLDLEAALEALDRSIIRLDACGLMAHDRRAEVSLRVVASARVVVEAHRGRVKPAPKKRRGRPRR